MNSYAGVTALMWQWAALVWRLLGGMSQRAWLRLGCRGHPTQIHKGTVKDLGLAELSTLPTALWSLWRSVKTAECGLWGQEDWPSLRWASETNLLFLQAACQINLFYKLTSLYFTTFLFSSSLLRVCSRSWLFSCFLWFPAKIYSQNGFGFVPTWSISSKKSFWLFYTQQSDVFSTFILPE